MLTVAEPLAVPQRLAFVSRCMTMPSENILGNVTFAPAVVAASSAVSMNVSFFIV